MSAVDQWRTDIAQYPKETAALLHYLCMSEIQQFPIQGHVIYVVIFIHYYCFVLAKNADKVTFGKRLDTKFIQTDEFAVAAVKTPELLRTAKVNHEICCNF